MAQVCHTSVKTWVWSWDSCKKPTVTRTCNPGTRQRQNGSLELDNQLTYPASYRSATVTYTWRVRKGKMEAKRARWMSPKWDTMLMELEAWEPWSQVQVEQTSLWYADLLGKAEALRVSVNFSFLLWTVTKFRTSWNFLLTLLMRFKLVQPLWKTVWGSSEIKDRTTIWSSNPISGCIVKGNELLPQRKVCKLITVSVTDTKSQNRPNGSSVDEQVKKENTESF